MAQTPADSVSDKTQPTDKTDNKAAANAHAEVTAQRQAGNVPVVDLNKMNAELSRQGYLPDVQISGADTARGAIELRDYDKKRNTSVHDLEKDVHSADPQVRELAKAAADYLKKVIEAGAAAGAAAGEVGAKVSGDTGGTATGGIGGDAGGNVKAGGALGGVAGAEAAGKVGGGIGSMAGGDAAGKAGADTSGGGGAAEPGHSHEAPPPPRTPDNVHKDASGNVSEVDYHDGTSRKFTRDAGGNITAVQDTDGSTWKHEGDGKWHRYVQDKNTKQTMDGTITVDNQTGDYSFAQADGKQTTVDHADGSSDIQRNDGSKVHLNTNGQIESSTAPDGSTRTFRHDEHGMLNQVVNPNGTSWQVNTDGSWTYYDKNGGQILSTGFAPEARADGTFITTENDGSQTTIRPDGTGQQKRADSSTVEMNAHGDVTSVTYKGGSKRSFDYDGNHDLVGMTDTNGKKWSKVDGQWKTSDGSPANADVSVTPEGKLVLNYGGNSSNEYRTDGSVVSKDAKGEVTHVHYLDGKDRDFQRDGSGNITTITETDGHKWTKEGDGKFHEYDQNGKSTGKTNDAKPTVDGDGNYDIANADGSGELRKSDGATVKRDKNGRVTEVDYSDGKNRKFGYDDKGNLNSMLDADGSIWKSTKDDGWVRLDPNNPFDQKKHQDGPVQVYPDGTVRMWNGSDKLVSTDNVTSTPDNSHNLWGTHEDDPLVAITPNAVHQGGLGDCYFLAAVGAVAQQNPEAIRQMIHDNGNGTYTVTFPGDPEHPVTVDEPTPAELGKYASDDNSNGMWVNVLEKAHRKYTGREDSDSGDNTDTGLKLLTPKGQKVDTDQFVSWEERGFLDFHFGSTSEEDTGKQLEKAMHDHKAVVASATDGNFISKFLGATNDPGNLVGDHVYAVVGYDPNSKTVTLRNPWGGQGGVNGTFTMSLHDFHDHMQEMSFQN